MGRIFIVAVLSITAFLTAYAEGIADAPWSLGIERGQASSAARSLELEKRRELWHWASIAMH